MVDPIVKDVIVHCSTLGISSCSVAKVSMSTIEVPCQKSWIIMIHHELQISTRKKILSWWSVRGHNNDGSITGLDSCSDGVMLEVIEQIKPSAHSYGYATACMPFVCFVGCECVIERDFYWPLILCSTSGGEKDDFWIVLSEMSD